MDPAPNKEFIMSKELRNSPSPTASIREGVVANVEDQQEVFRTDADAVNFRTVTWQRLIIILLKVQIATGVLSIPSAMGSLGAVPGALIVVGWQALNTCESTIGRSSSMVIGMADTQSRHSMYPDRLPQQAPLSQ